MRILDKYLLGQYLRSFFFTLLIFIPIAIAIDVSEKIDKFLAADASFGQIMDEYYVNFVIYYSNTFLPLALFISVIMFTSKLAGNTEIVAINSGQISFTRFLYPYFIGASAIFLYALAMNHFVVPKTQKEFLSFEKNYIKKKKKQEMNFVRNISLQLDEHNYIYMRRFDLVRNIGYHFSYERYEDLKLVSKLTAESITYKVKDSSYRLNQFKERRINEGKSDYIRNGSRKDTVFSFSPKDLEFADSKAKEMTTPELNNFIKVAESRGVKNLNSYYVERYKRTSLPFSAYILTLIAVSLSSRKKRGGLGVNLAIGIGMMFVYVFFMKVGEVLGSVAGANALLNVWIPNISFGILSIYLYYRAKN
ncbi:MAG: LptF/LptG family permease [Flavobacteriaceae bacterium]